MSGAEEKGFEPLVRFPVRRFSKPLPSTTRPLLQAARRLAPIPLFQARYAAFSHGFALVRRVSVRVVFEARVRADARDAAMQLVASP